MGEVYLRYIVGGIFLAAGVLKIMDPQNTADVIIFFEILSHEQANAVVIFAAVVEIILAILLVMGVQPTWTAGTVTVLSLLFVAISLLGWFNNWNLACGCFGRFSFGKFDGMMVVRNSLILTMSVGILYTARKRRALEQSVQIKPNRREQ